MASGESRDSEFLKRFCNAQSGRLDARAIAHAFGLYLSTFARTIGANANTLRSRSDSARLQPELKEAVRAFVLLSQMFPLDETIMSWMHHRLRSLDGLTPIELAERHGIIALREHVETMLSGNYS